MKKKKDSVKKNIVYQMIYEVLILCLPLILSPYLTRVLGADQLGIYSYTYSIAIYFGMFAMLGVKNHGNRVIAQHRDNPSELNKKFTEIYVIQLFLSILSVLGYLFYIFVFVKEYKSFFGIQILYVFSCMIDINWFFFGIEQFKITVFRNSIIKLITFAAVFLFVHSSEDLWIYCLIIAGGALISQVVMWIYLPRFVHFERIGFNDVLLNVKPMIVLFIPVLAVSLYNVMDKIMVGGMNSKTELGYYECSEKIINCTKTAITSVGTVMMPRMTNLAAKGDEKESNRYMLASIEFIMFIAFAFSFGIAAVADLFAPIYWGQNFAKCASLLKGLSIALPFSAFANFLRTQYLIPNCKDKTYIVSVVAGALVNLAANYFFIPIYGAFGAVIGTILAESIVCIIQTLWVIKNIQFKKYMEKSYPFLFIGLIMYFCVSIIGRYIGKGLSALCIEIILGGVIYVVLSAVYFAITKNTLFISLVSRIKRR